MFMSTENKSSTSHKTAHDNDFEVCVLCGKKTDTLKSQHIDLRNYYVEGGGQLCYNCATSFELN